MILILIKQLVSERDELRRKLDGKPKNERKKFTKPKTNTRKTRNPNRITLDKTELEEEIRTHPAPKICPNVVMISLHISTLSEKALSIFINVANVERPNKVMSRFWLGNIKSSLSC